MSQSPTQPYLLEVGTEELPASFLSTIHRELKARCQAMLDEAQLNYGSIDVQTTPRRIMLKIEELQTEQPDSEEWVKGPPASHAFDDNGQPTKAAEGFAKKCGVAVSELQRQTVDGTEYVMVHQQKKGQSVFDVLPKQLPELILGLPGSHFMMWDTSEIRFSRPIRWAVSLYGKDELPLQIGLTRSSNETFGHRFFAKEAPIRIDAPDSYVQQLKDSGSVWVRLADRKESIWAGIQKKAAELGGLVEPNEDLLDTVVDLVETPSIIEGRFNESFLSLPKEVIATVMIAHQKYFPVGSAQGGLLPYFLTVSNNPNPDAVANIRLGNEKVLKARLDDAAFFFKEDTKKPFEDYVESLKGMAFQKGLGSMYDKTHRLVSMVDRLLPMFNYSVEEQAQAKRSALLCKADLATAMVFELTELQGVVGRHYAALSGESDNVSSAIEAHYWPRFQGDRVATAPAGIVLSLADKLDTLFAVFSQTNAKLPTGSKDPMGLRRLANGLLATLIQNGIELDLNQAFALAYDNLGALAQDKKEDTVERVIQFLHQRFKGYLLDQQYSYDAIDAVFETDISPWASVVDVVRRLDELKTFQQSEEFKPVYESANRTGRILGDNYNKLASLESISPDLFEHDAEKALLDALTVVSKPDSWQSEVVALNPSVTQFYEDVLVNADNEQVKTNRHTLLSVLNQRYRQIADFTKLVV